MTTTTTITDWALTIGQRDKSESAWWNTSTVLKGRTCMTSLSAIKRVDSIDLGQEHEEENLSQSNNSPLNFAWQECCECLVWQRCRFSNKRLDVCVHGAEWRRKQCCTEPKAIIAMTPDSTVSVLRRQTDISGLSVTSPVKQQRREVKH